MHALSIGPLVFTGNQLAAIVGIGTFLIVTAVLGRRVDPHLEHWANIAPIIGLIAARVGYVLDHWASFAVEPWRIFAIWQGGFSLWWGVAGGMAVGTIWIRKWPSALWAVFALGLSLWTWTIVDRLTADTAETPVPVGAFERLDGRRMTLAGTVGKPTIINLWASWCPPCRREMPALVQAATRHRDVRFLFVNQGESREKIMAYLSAAKLAPTDVLLDPLGDVARHYKMPGLPSTLFIGADGRIFATHVGEISPEEIDDELANIERAGHSPT